MQSKTKKGSKKGSDINQPSKETDFVEDDIVSKRNRRSTKSPIIETEKITTTTTDTTQMEEEVDFEDDGMDTGGDGDQDPDDIDDDLNGDEDVEEDEKSDSDSSTNNREPSMKSVVLRNSNRLASKMKKRDSSKALKSVRTSIKPDRNQLVKRIVVSDPLPYLQTLGQKSVDAFFLKIDDQQVPFEDRNNHINEPILTAAESHTPGDEGGKPGRAKY